MNDRLSEVNKLKRNKVYSKVNKVEHKKKVNKWIVGKLMAEAREDAKNSASGVHGNFQCSGCGIWYNIGYGKLVKFYSRPFSDYEYVCKDCLKKVGKGSYCVAE